MCIRDIQPIDWATERFEPGRRDGTDHPDATTTYQHIITAPSDSSHEHWDQLQAQLTQLEYNDG
eukprot:5855200-Prorocentrum_lima.AAC.1